MGKIRIFKYLPIADTGRHHHKSQAREETRWQQPIAPYHRDGDYMQLPPEDQRVTHHFEAYWR